jgi:hypothetical protein
VITNIQSSVPSAVPQDVQSEKNVNLSSKVQNHSQLEDKVKTAASFKDLFTLQTVGNIWNRVKVTVAEGVNRLWSLCQLVFNKIFFWNSPLTTVVETEQGKQAIINSFMGKELTDSTVTLKKENGAIEVNSQFQKDLGRSDIWWNGKPLLNKKVKTEEVPQFEACQKLKKELGEVGFKNLTVIANQSSTADATGYIMGKYMTNKEVVIGLGLYGHEVTYKLDTRDPNYLKLSIIVDYALVEQQKIAELPDNTAPKGIGEKYIILRRDIQIPRAELNTNWQEQEGSPLAPGLIVKDTISYPCESYKQARRAVL